MSRYIFTKISKSIFGVIPDMIISPKIDRMSTSLLRQSANRDEFF